MAKDTMDNVIDKRSHDRKVLSLAKWSRAVEAELSSTRACGKPLDCPTVAASVSLNEIGSKSWMVSISNVRNNSSKETRV